MIAMKFGPVLSTTYNLLKSSDSQSIIWNRFIESQPDKKKTVVVISSPGIEDLSRNDSQILEKVYNQYGHQYRFSLVELTHEFPEWTQYRQDRKVSPVNPIEILISNGKEEVITSYQEYLSVKREDNALFV